MRILGIMDSHLSSAALLDNGRVVAAVREEVITRDKGFARFPEQAVRQVLAQAGVEGESLDAVAFGIAADLFDTPRFQARESGIKRNAVSAATLAMPRSFTRSQLLRKGWVAAVGGARRRRTITEQGALLAELGISRERLHFLPHHRCHAATALLLDPDPGDTLVMVADGYGDGESGGVWAMRGDRFQRLQRISFADSLGGIYCRVTRVLGMKPWEHEHKVMGLAPYGEDPRGEQVLARLRRLFTMRDGRLENSTRLSGVFLERRLAREVQGFRFDHVAWALQRLSEEVICAWVAHHVERTGIGRVALAGGVFLNVKVNQAVAALPGVERLFIVPPAGDDSASLGAALAFWAGEVGWAEARAQAAPLSHLYLGPDLDPAAIEAAVAEARGAGHAVERPEQMARAVAPLLLEGQVVARCVGPAEFGPRALGNRSILCRADDIGAARRVNRMIKMRDFWMPFAPTVLDGAADLFLHNPKGIPAPYMVLAQDATAHGRRHLAAALHPHDFTARPQVLRREQNPAYYELIETYASLGGVPALLNTSFNLHGEPIVLTPQDALRTFSASGLENMILGPYLIKK